MEQRARVRGLEMCSQAFSSSSSIGFVPDCVGANVDEGLNRFDAAVAVLGNDELKVVSPLFKLLHALDFVFAFPPSCVRGSKRDGKGT